MSFFTKLKSLFSATKYRINREVLAKYIEETISFAVKENLSFCDEFILSKNDEDSKIYLKILNFDAPCNNPLDSEKHLKGVIIFVRNKKGYAPEIDEKYYSANDFILSKLSDFPEWFFMYNDLGEPTMLKDYKVN